MSNTPVTTTYLAEAADAAAWDPFRFAPIGNPHRSRFAGALEESRVR